jgi:hypothetical protein
MDDRAFPYPLSCFTHVGKGNVFISEISLDFIYLFI